MTNVNKKSTQTKTSTRHDSVGGALGGRAPKRHGRAAKSVSLVQESDTARLRFVQTAFARRAKAPLASGSDRKIIYTHTQGVDAFVTLLSQATPMELVEAERHGIDSIFLKDLSKCMDIPAVRIFDIVGIPKATAEKKVASKASITGASGQAALGLARLLSIARSIVDNSTADEAKDFDVAKWLGQWVERPQPALGGHKPADLISTPTGLDMVTKVLGAIESGAYQ